ncbi:hypothetical protein H9Q70_013800 [Fusarium xylarioides]|nr:hypothetical protein H9Q70_013800 [Fusarium xylarioides]
MAPAKTEVLVVDQPALHSKTVATEEVTPLPDLAPPLLPTEKIGPMGWIRSLLHFELGENYNAEEITSILKRAYSAFKERTPIAGCEAVPTAEYLETGLLQLRHYGDEIEHDFLVKDFLDDDFPSFEELKRRGYPTSVLDPDVVCQRGLGGEWPCAGDRLNTTMVQLNFIKGGLLLNVLFLHAYIDGTTAYKFTEIFAEEVRKAQGLPITNPAEIPCDDRAKLMKPSDTIVGKPEDHPDLADIALVVRGAVNKSKDTYLATISSLVDGLGNVSRLIPAIFLDMPGNHALFSSWREFPFYDIQWGPALGDRIKAIRPPSVGVTHSMHIILPDRPEAGPGVEVFVGMENSAMESLLENPLWRKYAQGPEKA